MRGFSTKEGLISLKTFKERVKNVVGHRAEKGRILMVDEAQDCHKLEREILYEIFQPKNVVISYGGKEQLIRYAEVCDWNVFRDKNILIKKLSSGNKSYRIKQSILDFCNFIAEKHSIDLTLKSNTSEDNGHLIFDFRSYEQASNSDIFSDLLERGLVNACSPLESLLILDINPKSKGTKSSPTNIKGKVNEYGVIVDSVIGNNSPFSYENKLGQKADFWVGAKDNKSDLSIPHSNEVRIVNYESCRGLEAWCVICFNIDSFYYSKTKSDNADVYLLHESLFEIKREKRAAMYAITWILLAATRAIDTLYLQLSHEENDLYKLCQDYAKISPADCTIYGE